MAAGNADEVTSFSTAVRGYDRDEVHEAIARERQRTRELDERAAFLERELAALRVAAGLTDRRHVVRRTVETMTDAWEQAARITLDAEYAAGRERAHAEGQVSARLTAAQEQFDAAAAAAQADADRLLEDARAHAARLGEHAEEQVDRARGAAHSLVEAATERAKNVIRQFSSTLETVQSDAAAELTQRQQTADGDVAIAEATLRRAKKDVRFADEQAAAQREAILADAREQALRVPSSVPTEVDRLQSEVDRSVAELAELMISAGGRLTEARPGAAVPSPSGSRDVAAPAEA